MSFINNSFSLNKDFYFADFISLFKPVVYPSYDTLKTVFTQHFPLCCIHVQKGRGYFHVKDLNTIYVDGDSFDNYVLTELSTKDMNECTKGIFKYMVTKVKKIQKYEFNEDVEMSVPIDKLMIDCNIKSYHGFISNPLCKDNRYFNTWGNFEGEGKVENYDMEIVQPIIDFIKVRYCENNDDILQFMLSYFGTLIQKPGKKTRVSIIFYSKNKQVGKGSLYKFIRNMLGPQYCAMDNNLTRRLDSRFNKVFENKVLYVFDETAMNKDSFHSTSDMMKNLITEDTLAIEPKNKEVYQTLNMLNIWINTNNMIPLKLEEGDVRYLVLHVNEENSNEKPYWGNIHKTVFSKESGHHFYAYLKQFKCDLGNIPHTKLKVQMIESSAPNPKKFLRQALEEEDLGYMRSEPIIYKNTKIYEIIEPATLYNKYKNWCENNGETKVSSAVFKRLLGLGEPIQKKNFEGKSTFRFYSIETLKSLI